MVAYSCGIIKVLIKAEHRNTVHTMFSIGFHNVCTIYATMIMM